MIEMNSMEFKIQCIQAFDLFWLIDVIISSVCCT